MEFLDIQVGDEVRILSAKWNQSVYGYYQLGNPTRHNNSVVTITQLRPYFNSFGSFNLLGFRCDEYTYYLIPVAELIEPMNKSLSAVSKSKYLAFDKKYNTSLIG